MDDNVSSRRLLESVLRSGLHLKCDIFASGEAALRFFKELESKAPPLSR